MGTVAASAALCILALGNWQMAKVPVDISPILAYAQSHEIAGNDISGEALKLPAISLLEASQRPLLAARRRPWTPPQLPPVAPMAEMPPETPVAPPAPPPSVMLLGIQKTPNGSTVLLSAQSGVAPNWVKEGDTYESWRVRNINGASVELASGDLQITLELYPAAQTGLKLP